jgi:hypothetical protein
MHNRVYPAGHVVWRIWWPPNGHDCRCTVIGMTAAQVKEQGLIVQQDDPTGQMIPLFDDGGALVSIIELRPDLGWANNVGLGLADSVAAAAVSKMANYPAWINSLVLESISTDNDAALLLATEGGNGN